MIRARILDEAGFSTKQLASRLRVIGQIQSMSAAGISLRRLPFGDSAESEDDVSTFNCNYVLGMKRV